MTDRSQGIAARCATLPGIHHPYRAGEATAVVPFDYARIIFAATYGYLFFAETSDLWTWMGAAVLIGSTLYIALRDIRVGAPQLRTPAAP